MGRFAKELPQTAEIRFHRHDETAAQRGFSKAAAGISPRLCSVPRRLRSARTAVSSKKLDRFGKYDNAEGYLDAFSRFVKENADKVDALSILLKRPRDWRPKALEELRRTLAIKTSLMSANFRKRTGLPATRRWPT
jgi:hypothetical protein